MLPPRLSTLRKKNAPKKKDVNVEEKYKDKQCYQSDCAGCVVLCKKGQKCRCTFCDCGCQEAFGKGKLCYKSDCDKCKEKCEQSTDGTCICNLGRCGCDGINCQCCRWCNPETGCKGAGSCDFVDKHDEKCKGHSNDPIKEYDGGTYYCIHGKEDGKCDESNCPGTTTYVAGKCRFKCTNCGRLCDQDRCIIWIRVIVIGLIILASLFVMRAICPEKFRKITTGIRAAFSSSTRHHGRSLSNIVGDKLPEDMNVDRYPAFRPKAFAGLV